MSERREAGRWRRGARFPPLSTIRHCTAGLRVGGTRCRNAPYRSGLRATLAYPEEYRGLRDTGRGGGAEVTGWIRALTAPVSTEMRIVTGWGCVLPRH
ncbi:hypothetical protein cyc_03029 [Cyclospora cayetanensis]|uniref:Uncharacterized protein n=1 Tax=Cyclospora cayetanensis TaxID=88456 RepID=A0A1D3CX13_9EIME|nr:hypothetical protein cyc_03029 [Cyclospora cayetanensis]